MKQSELNRAVSRCTGETISTVKRLGFFLLEPTGTAASQDPEFGPEVIDWDELDQRRYTEGGGDLPRASVRT